MTTFATVELESVQPEKLSFQKVYVGEKCPYDDFCTEIEESTTYKSELSTLLSYMNFMAAGQSLPVTKFRSIQGVKGGYEFKSKHLRIYAIKVDPNVYIILGGLKTTQKADIARLKRMGKEFVESLSLKSM